MARRPKVWQKRILITLLAILVVALPVGMAVLLPSGVIWNLLLQGTTLVQRFVVMVSAFPAWLFRY